MADEHHRAADAAERRANRGCVIFNRIELVLGRDHFIAVGLKQIDNLAIAGSVGPKAVSENNSWFGRHVAPPKGLGLG
jgi:hypothetical protein